MKASTTRSTAAVPCCARWCTRGTWDERPAGVFTSTAMHETCAKEPQMKINDLDPSVEKQAIRQFILGSVALAQLDDDADLFEAGIVNSLFAVQLLAFVEKTFAIEVGMDDLDIDNFKSVNATAAFVKRRNGPA